MLIRSAALQEPSEYDGILIPHMQAVRANEWARQLRVEPREDSTFYRLRMPEVV